MLKKVKIAIDAMGGDNSPKKIIEGIEISLRSNQNNFFYFMINLCQFNYFWLFESFLNSSSP